MPASFPERFGINSARSDTTHGHAIWSQQRERESRYHFVGDVRKVLKRDWDMLIAFPPCTHLSASGARWWPLKQREQREAIGFVRMLWDSGIKRVAIENPIGRLSTAWRRPTQIIQPWQFGHGETKATCLWLKGLRPLRPTRIVDGRESRIHRMPESASRAKERSRTYSGVAEAMALHWGIDDF